MESLIFFGAKGVSECIAEDRVGFDLGGTGG